MIGLVSDNKTERLLVDIWATEATRRTMSRTTNVRYFDDSIVQAVAGEENSHARFCGKQVGIPTGAGDIGVSYRVVRFRNHSPLIGSVLWDTDIEGAI